MDTESKHNTGEIPINVQSNNQTREVFIRKTATAMLLVVTPGAILGAIALLSKGDTSNAAIVGSVGLFLDTVGWTLRWATDEKNIKSDSRANNLPKNPDN